MFSEDSAALNNLASEFKEAIHTVRRTRQGLDRIIVDEYNLGATARDIARAVDPHLTVTYIVAVLIAHFPDRRDALVAECDPDDGTGVTAAELQMLAPMPLLDLIELGLVHFVTNPYGSKFRINPELLASVPV